MDVKEEKTKLRQSVLDIFANPLAGPILKAWGMQEAGQLNALLKQLLGSIELLKEVEDEDHATED